MAWWWVLAAFVGLNAAFLVWMLVTAGDDDYGDENYAEMTDLEAWKK